MTDLPSENSSFEFRAVEKVVDETVPRQIPAEKRKRRLRKRSQGLESLLRRPTLGKDSFIQDKEFGVLYLRISPSGRSAFYFYKSICGKPVKIKIADAKLMSLQEARIEVIRWLRELNAGVHPRRSRMALTGYDLTLQQLGQRYYEQYMQHNLARPNDEYRRLCLHWKPLAHKRVTELTTNGIQRWVNDLATNQSPASAKRLFAQLRACLKWGYIQRLVLFDGPCPWEGVKTPRTFGRERLLTKDEAKRLFDFLSTHPGIKTDIVWLLMMTGMRRGNVLSMTWESIDFDSRTWTITAKKAKGRKTIRQPLTDAAIAILRRRQQISEGLYVFPSAVSARKHWGKLERWWKTVCKECNLHDFHLHDLRHYFGTNLAMSGANAFEIQTAMAHASMETSKSYIHLAQSQSLRSQIEKSQQHIPLNSTLNVNDAGNPAAEIIRPSCEDRSPVAAIKSHSTLSVIERGIWEGKVLQVLVAKKGKPAVKKDFHSHIHQADGIRLTSKKLEEVLAGLVDRGIIRTVREDLSSHVLRYVLSE